MGPWEAANADLGPQAKTTKPSSNPTKARKPMSCLLSPANRPIHGPSSVDLKNYALLLGRRAEVKKIG